MAKLTYDAAAQFLQAHVNEPADLELLLDVIADYCHETQSELDSAWSGTSPGVWSDLGKIARKAHAQVDRAIVKHLGR